MSEALASLPVGAPQATPDPAVVEVADTFLALMRSFNRAKARFVAAAEHNVEWSAQIILRRLATEGPMRASELATCLQSDPSTVSRQVAGLVKDGLLERRADPEDGRASILALTAKADEVLAAHEQMRVAHFAAMLTDWDERDLHRFAGLLRRFTSDFDKAGPKLDPKIDPEPVATPHGSAEGKH